MTLPADTGERILLEKESPLMIARHLSAYVFASELVRQREVLDIGCGEGYGSFYLAGHARKACGIDYNDQVISYAQGKYRKDNLSFRVLDVRRLAELGERFSAVCSFQFIEHLREPAAFLDDVKSLLSAGGIFLCSTCNKHDASPGSEVPCNKFHMREYDLPEFTGLLQSRFASVEMWGLHRKAKLEFYLRLKKSGVCNILPAGINPVKKFFGRMDTQNFEFSKDKPGSALDFLAVCRI
ncbi:MAG: class I SAM-dependent methyltransferase [Candidatus Omnitrophica bacterium]|nr:class I SAM-dependent methyltransferase [Candidatus Omnitrophota bacterium]